MFRVEVPSKEEEEEEKEEMKEEKEEEEEEEEDETGVILFLRRLPLNSLISSTFLLPFWQRSTDPKPNI